MSVVPTMTATIEGYGLITGKPVSVKVSQANVGHGITFTVNNTTPITATLSSVVHTDRGVTLANAEGQTLSIVEHFLSAASFTGLSDLDVTINGAPELPILEGSARSWVDFLEKNFPEKSSQTEHRLRHAVVHHHSDDIILYALPDTHFKISYSVNFNHPQLKNRWVHWDSKADSRSLIINAGTFGYVNELPALQAKGLALGANLDNSLGLTENGDYTRPLHHDDEPVYHKVLDCIGDLRLSGINPLNLKAHVFALNAGHTSHIAFAQKLLTAIS